MQLIHIEAEQLLKELENDKNGKKNNERGISEFLSNTPDNRPPPNKVNQDNNIEIFDKDQLESEGVDFEDLKEEAFINKAEEILSNSENKKEKEVRLTEVIDENSQKRGSKKGRRRTKGSNKRKSYNVSKKSSKNTTKTKSKRSSEIQKIPMPKKSIIKRTSTSKKGEFAPKPVKFKKASEGEDIPVLNGKKVGNGKASPGINEEESSADDSEEEESEQKSLKTKNTRMSRMSKMSRKSKTMETKTEVSEMEGIRRKYPKLVKITNSTAYQV